MKRVLLPIDGSDRSRRTIRMLKTLYQPGEGKVILATVVAREERLESDYIRKRWKDSSDEIFGAVLPQLEGWDVETVLLEGSPGAEIVRYAEEGDIDQIIMTRSSRGPLRKLGSVAAYIVRRAPSQDLIIMHETKADGGDLPPTA
jgi:nucleotide-binding universal stress UspA family protein